LKNVLTSGFICQNEQQSNGTEAAVAHDIAATVETLHDMDVDDLLKYINGDDKSQAKATTRKAAKRARQKQRKVPESFIFRLHVDYLLGKCYSMVVSMFSIKKVPRVGPVHPLSPLSIHFTFCSFFYFSPFLFSFTLPIFFFCPSLPFILPELSHFVSRPEVIGGDRT